MSWFFLALVGPFLYALSNHIDKILLEKYFKESGVGTLLLFSSLLSALAIPFLYIADPTVFTIDGFNMLVLAFVGVCNVLLLLCWFMALKDDEASIAVVFYQLVPVLGLILGYFILGETLTKIQLFAMITIIIGTTIISFEIDADNNFTLRTKTAFYMLCASFLWALESVIFKAVALEENVVRSLFWEHLMLTLIGICIFVCVKSYRINFINAIKTNSRAIIGLNFTNESLYMLGNLASSFAYMLAPVALILLTNSFQPIFVFVIGIILTLFFPHVSVENIQAKNVAQKLFAIIITGIGTYILLSY